MFPQLGDVIVPHQLHEPAPFAEVDQEEVDPSAQYAEASDRLGNLEPPLQNVELLFSSEAIRDHEDMGFLLDDQAPISALVAYELGVPKQAEPSPPPPPSPPLLPSSPLLPTIAPIKDKTNEKSKKKGAKSHAEQPALDNTPEFHGPVQRVQESVEEANWSPIFWIPDAVVEHSDVGPAPEQKGKKGKSKAKAHTVPVPTPIPIPDSSGLDHEPHLTETTIDKQQSFKRFNEGWILPPDQKRGGRKAERLPPLPSKKKKPRLYCFFFSPAFR